MIVYLIRPWDPVKQWKSKFESHKLRVIWETFKKEWLLETPGYLHLTSSELPVDKKCHPWRSKQRGVWALTGSSIIHFDYNDKFHSKESRNYRILIVFLVKPWEPNKQWKSKFESQQIESYLGTVKKNGDYWKTSII